VIRLGHVNDLNLMGNHIFYLEHGIGFQLRRWALKIMSLLISAHRLFTLTQSRRLRRLLEGNFSVQVLTSPTTTPYSCDLSSETIQVALDAALARTGYLSADPDEDRRWFIERLLKGLEAPNVVRWKPTVHAELAMIMAMVGGEIKYVEPYIGVSKPSCIMCSHYIRAFNEVTSLPVRTFGSDLLLPKQKITIKGSHGKAYPGWFWPSLPSLDGKIRTAFLRRIREQLRCDFEQQVETRLLDSGVGSGGPELKLGRTNVEIYQLFDESVRTKE